MGALVEVNLTELQDARVEHYEADMAITLEDKGVRTWTYTSTRDKGADHNEASLRFPSLFILLHFCMLINNVQAPSIIV